MIHGINIKLDKTGGIREALCAVSAATNANLQIWVGIMVSSRLSCSAASHILPYATFGGDLDGPLLVTEATDKFTDGMEWDKATGMVRPSPSHNGIGVTAKH
jgi:L-alanine-DL-glutamate epimerase-like enolase superfamily enzyme